MHELYEENEWTETNKRTNNVKLSFNRYNDDFLFDSRFLTDLFDFSSLVEPLVDSLLCDPDLSFSLSFSSVTTIAAEGKGEWSGCGDGLADTDDCESFDWWWDEWGIERLDEGRVMVEGGARADSEGLVRMSESR